MMNANNAYYGNESNTSISYLEFGSVDIEKKKKTIWGYWQDQEAYDLYMFARYSRDLFSFRHYLDNKEEHNLDGLMKRIKCSAHDKLLDYIFKYAGFVIDNMGGWRCELGSSIYGLIEELMALDIVFSAGRHVNGFRTGKYLACDISEMMNEGAAIFHPDAEIISSVAPTTKELIEEIKRRSIHLELFYGLSVSMRYSLRNSQDILDMAQMCGLQIYNRLSMSFGETLSFIYGTGKSVYVISLPELVKGAEKEGVCIKYCTGNMQREKDGVDTIRVSLAISKEENRVNSFIQEYDRCIDIANKEGVGMEGGSWRDIRELQ